MAHISENKIIKLLRIPANKWILYLLITILMVILISIIDFFLGILYFKDASSLIYTTNLGIVFFALYFGWFFWTLYSKTYDNYNQFIIGILYLLATAFFIGFIIYRIILINDVYLTNLLKLKNMTSDIPFPQNNESLFFTKYMKLSNYVNLKRVELIESCIFLGVFMISVAEIFICTNKIHYIFQLIYFHFHTQNYIDDKKNNFLHKASKHLFKFDKNIKYATLKQLYFLKTHNIKFHPGITKIRATKIIKNVEKK